MDTPGTGAVVEEHETRTADFLELERRVRERHNSETLRIKESADAIIYLVGAVARASDRELLETFASASDGARAMNALGVVAKVDLSGTLLERRHELAAKIASQLDKQLNAVLPVSASLTRVLHRLAADEHRLLKRVAEAVGRIPPNSTTCCSRTRSCSRNTSLPGCPVSPAERRELRAEMGGEWRVFVTIIAEVRGGGTDTDIGQRLADIGGFEALNETLRRHFLERAQMLRCHRVMNEGREAVSDLRFGHILPLHRRATSDAAQLSRFLSFVAHSTGDPEVGTELEAYLRRQLDSRDRVEALEQTREQVDADLNALTRALAEHHADFAALQALSESPGSFTSEEAEELRALLGMYGSDTAPRLGGEVPLDVVGERQIRWRVARDTVPRGTARWIVADRAQVRLGFIAGELLQAPAAAQASS